jgi:hypothetical protein
MADQGGLSPLLRAWISILEILNCENDYYSRYFSIGSLVSCNDNAVLGGSVKSRIPCPLFSTCLTCT